MGTATSTDQHRGSFRPRAIYTVALLCAMAFLNTADMTVLFGVQGSVQSAFHLSDTQLGLLNAIFTAAIAVGAIPLGIWADRGSRRLVIGLGIGVWSLFTLLTGFAQGFVQMLAIRSVVGVGEASNQPAGASLIGDLFGKRSRGRANAAIATAGGLGIGLGFVLGGVIGQQFGWRAAFMILGGPGLLLALLAFTLHEPRRGAAEERGPKVDRPRDAGWTALGQLLRIRTFAAATAAGGLSMFGFAILGFLPLYLQRKFGLSLAEAGGLVGGPQTIGTLISAPLIGGLIDWRGRRSAAAAVEVGIAGTLIAAGAAAVMFTVYSIPVYVAAELVFSVSAAAAIIAPIVILQNVIVPSLRASAGSINLTISRLAGSAISPIVVGVISDLLGGNLGLSMLVVGPVAFVLSAACLVFSRMGRDVSAMESSWAHREEPASQPAAAALPA